MKYKKIFLKVQNVYLFILCTRQFRTKKIRPAGITALTGRIPYVNRSRHAGGTAYHPRIAAANTVCNCALSYACRPSMKCFIFSSGDMVGLPKSALDPIAVRISSNVSADWPRISASRCCKLSAVSAICTDWYPTFCATLHKSTLPIAVGYPPTDSCDSLLNTT